MIFGVALRTQVWVGHVAEDTVVLVLVYARLPVEWWLLICSLSGPEQ